MVATIDASDVPLVVGYNWQAITVKNPRGAHNLAFRRDRLAGGILMHRVIACPGDERHVKHRDGNGLNNCRSNLVLSDGTAVSDMASA